MSIAAAGAARPHRWSQCGCWHIYSAWDAAGRSSANLRFISGVQPLLFAAGQSDTQPRQVEQGRSESLVVELCNRFPVFHMLGQDLWAVIFHNSDLVFTVAQFSSPPGFVHQELLYPVAVWLMTGRGLYPAAALAASDWRALLFSGGDGSTSFPKSSHNLRKKKKSVGRPPSILVVVPGCITFLLLLHATAKGSYTIFVTFFFFLI